MTSRLKKSAGPTSTDASVTIAHRSSRVGSGSVSLPSTSAACACFHASSFLCAFSIMTIAASTIAPIAIAIPPSDMMFAFTPCARITMNAASTPSGSDTTATSDERRCSRNATHTSATTANSSSSLPRRWSTARSISAERSYTGTISTPGGSPGFSCSSFALTAWIVSHAFLPERSTTMPPVTSPSPSSSAMPRRISGPI